ncbi:MAG TPA: hypothetical protein VIN38_02895 [Thiobacillus sp.]
MQTRVNDLIQGYAHPTIQRFAGATAVCAPRKSKRTHAWHASYAVLAVLTTLLMLNGCDKQGPAEQAGSQVDQTVKDMDLPPPSAGNPSDHTINQPGPAQEAGKALDEAREKMGEKVEEAGERMQQP